MTQSSPRSSTSLEARLTLPEGLDRDALFERLNMVYLAPCDARRLPLEAGSLDLVASHAVLEHIPPSTLRELFAEFSRVLKPGGMTCHLVDNSDHWAHHDKSITQVNFLKYDDRLWRLTSLNPLDYQNRLRHSEYVAMLEELGFAVVFQMKDVDPRALAALPALPLAQRFRRFSPEELATVTSYLVAAKPRVAG